MTVESMQRLRLEIALMVLPFALSAGCTTNLVPEHSPSPNSRFVAAVPAAAPADRLTRGLEEAGPGEAFVVADGPDGSLLNVVVEREYHAASGRLCRRLRVEQGERIACRDALGVWRLLPSLTNKALPALSAEQASAGWR